MMSRFEADAHFFGNREQSYIQIQDQEQDKCYKSSRVQLVDKITAVYKNDQEEQISVAPENGEKFKSASESQAEKGNQETRSKLVKMGVILILCFLFLHFVLIIIAMNRTSEFSLSSSSSTSGFSAWKNQTHETGQILNEMKLELGEIEKWKNLTEEKFESHPFQIKPILNQTKIDKQLEALENENRQLRNSHEELAEQFKSVRHNFEQFDSNISSSRDVSLPTPAPAENEHQTPIDPELLQNCRDAMDNLPSPRSTKQRIYLRGNGTNLEVLCDFETDGGGWTIIQKRTSGPKEEFSRNWNDYARGFGSLDENFWLGLQNIHALTKNVDQELRIELEDFEGNKRWAKYASFSISGSADFYRLTISGFDEDSTAGDSMTDSQYANHGMRFSTKDRDNDKWNGVHCAVAHRGGGGWWFNACGDSNLNGLYFDKGETVIANKGIYWYSWKGTSYSLAKSEMKIRTRRP